MTLKVTENAPVREPAERWTTADAGELYDVSAWGKGYFSVGGNGHVGVHPTKDSARYIDLKELVDKLELRGIGLPILIRFAEILKHRLGEMHDAFARRPQEEHVDDERREEEGDLDGQEPDHVTTSIPRAPRNGSGIGEGAYQYIRRRTLARTNFAGCRR